MNSLPFHRIQQFDAATCVGAGLLCLLATTPLEEIAGLPRPLLSGAGLFLLVFGALVFWSSLRPAAPVVRAVAAANIGWALASAGLLLAAPFPITALGQALVGAQAVAVGVIAGLQWMAADRLASPAPRH